MFSASGLFWLVWAFLFNFVQNPQQVRSDRGLAFVERCLDRLFQRFDQLFERGDLGHASPFMPSHQSIRIAFMKIKQKRDQIVQNYSNRACIGMRQVRSPCDIAACSVIVDCLVCGLLRFWGERCQYVQPVMA